MRLLKTNKQTKKTEFRVKVEDLSLGNPSDLSDYSECLGLEMTFNKLLQKCYMQEVGQTSK